MKQPLFHLIIILALFLISPLSAQACEGNCDPANCSKYKAGNQQEGAQAAMAGEKNAALDPICGVKIGESHAVDQVEYKGKKYYFCMKDEKEAFLKEPEKYLQNIQE